MDVEIVETGSKRDASGRRIESMQERERLLASYDCSGLTQVAFAKREGIAYSTFVYWIKYRRQCQRKGKACATPPKPTAPKQVFHEVAAPAPTPEPGLLNLEVSLPDGSIVRGTDPHALASLIKALRC